MTHIILDDKTAKLLKPHVESADTADCWLEDVERLPASKAGLYKVFQHEDADPKWVQKQDIGRYPWIAINSVWALYEGIPMKKVTPDCYRVVNNDGVSLITLDVSESVESGRNFYMKPTIRCHYEGRWHFIYALDKYLPRYGVATYDSLIAFSRSVESLEKATGGRYLYDEPILNFTSPLVKSKSVYQRVFSFMDFKNDSMSPEDLERKRLQGKRRQSESAKRTNRIRNSKSIRKIINAILELRASGQPVNKSSVTMAAKVARNTVYNHWDAEEVRKARGE